MLLLLPPSEGKATEAGEQPSFRVARADDAAPVHGVLKQLAQLKPDERLKWYGVRQPEQAATWHEHNLAALDAPTLPAFARYTGVVYQHLDARSLRAKKRLAQRVAIVSALFGLVPADAPLPRYKLPVNTWLARYWRPFNTERLTRLAGRQPVVDLLPQAYAKAIDTSAALRVDFKTEGGRRSAGHFGKAIKGKFVRWVLENDVRDPGAFEGFREEGYTWDGANFVQR